MPCPDFRFFKFVLRYSIVDRWKEKVHRRIEVALRILSSDACFINVMHRALMSPGLISFNVVALVIRATFGGCIMEEYV